MCIFRYWDELRQLATETEQFLTCDTIFININSFSPAVNNLKIFFLYVCFHKKIN